MWKRLRRKEPAAAKGGSSKQKEETKEAEAEAVGTPSTVPLGFDEEEEVANAGVPRTSSHGSQGSEYFDAQELYADNFKLKRERVRLLEDLSKKRFREAQLAAQLEETEEERVALEQKLMELVDGLHERDLRLARLEQQKAEAEEVLQALADYHESQKQGQEQQPRPRGKQQGRVRRMLITLAPGTAFLLLLLVVNALLPALDHRLLGGLGGLLLSPRSAFWSNRASGLPRLGRGDVLREGEYLRSCRPLVAGLGGSGCADPHVLHMRHDGILTMYRGASPTNHLGAVWTSSSTSYSKADGRATFSATVDKKGGLKVVKVEDGHKKGPKETIVFSRPVSRLPPALHGLLAK